MASDAIVRCERVTKAFKDRSGTEQVVLEDLDFEQQVEMDVRYIHERSMWLDLKLLLLTVPAVLSGRGAY